METILGGLLSTTIIISSLVSLLIVHIHYKLTKEYRFWNKQGVKGPWSLPIIGPIWTMFTKNRLHLELQRVRKYGKIYFDPSFGFINLVIADPEVLRQILVKDFDAFPDHNSSESMSKYHRNFLIWLKGDEWRQTRALISPTFTSGKIKRMFKFLEVCSDDLIECIREDLRRDDKKTRDPSIVNLMDIYGMFTFDGIATCGYGIKMKYERGMVDLKSAASKNEFVHQALRLVEFSAFRIIARRFLPGFLKGIFKFETSMDSRFEPIVSRIEQIIERRKQDSATASKHDDLLQLLLDAQSGNQMELSELDQAENHHASLTKDSLLSDQVMLSGNGSNKKQLNSLEVISEAILMLSVGMDTTRTLLTGCTYALAFHPDIQQRLYEELKQLVETTAEEKERFSYDTITLCPYLDAVVSETLRMLSPSVKTDRNASRDYFVEKYNIYIPKGTFVMLGIYSVQNNPEFWERPDQFNPDRFMPENRAKIVPGTYIPFSMGPRHCVGMRFALMEAKLGLARVMMRYRFEPAPGTKFPPEPAAKISINTIKDPRVRMVAR